MYSDECGTHTCRQTRAWNPETAKGNANPALSSFVAVSCLYLSLADHPCETPPCLVEQKDQKYI